MSKNDQSILFALSGSQQPNWIYANVKIGRPYEKGWQVVIDVLPIIYADSNFS